MKILFICRGNVGRSQIAAALCAKIAPEHEVRSTGTRVVGKDGTPRDGQMLKDMDVAIHVRKVLEEEGIDTENFVRRQLTPEIVEWTDKIIVMAEPETIPDYLKKSPKAIYWDILDPKDTPLEAHREMKEKIKGLVKELLNSL
jgi:protein-tyrosine-phosphatase